MLRQTTNWQGRNANAVVRPYTVLRVNLVDHMHRNVFVRIEFGSHSTPLPLEANSPNPNPPFFLREGAVNHEAPGVKATGTMGIVTGLVITLLLSLPTALEPSG